MTQYHVAEVALLHRRLLPGLLTDLGPHAISYFYKTALEVSGTHAWVALDEHDTIVGFALGTDRGSDLYDRVIRRRPIRGIANMTADLFFRPAAFIKIGWWFLKARPDNPEFDAPELIYLAVDPDGKGGGSAHFLFKHAYDLFRGKGFTQFQLSVAEDNTSAQAFFENMGGKRLATYEDGGIRRIRYTYTYAS